MLVVLNTKVEIVMNANESTRFKMDTTGVILEKDRKKMPKIIVGLRGTTALKIEHAFRQMGWRVSAADGADETRAVAERCRAAVVILPVSQFAESGFLTCAKLVAAMPKTRVWLVGPAEEELERFALFAGAAGYFSENSSVRDMAEAMSRPHAPTAR